MARRRSFLAPLSSLLKRGWIHSLFTFGAGVFFLFSAVVLVWLITIDIPRVEGFHNRKVAESTKIYDRSEKILLYDVHGTVRRTIIPLQDVSRYAKNATIAIEDANFYHHIGIQPTSLVRATIANIRTGRFSQGGSTITQQVVKNTLLSSEKTITRKIKELILALRIEQMLTKDQILEIYLNETPYGGTLYGIEEASMFFFGKQAKDITLPEAAYLAALPQAPTYFSPFGNHRKELEARKNLVLLKMKENGFIDEKEYKDALVTQVTFSSADGNSIRAPHFVFYVLEQLEAAYGADVVSDGGLHVITTLDWDMQQKAEELVRAHALRNKVAFNAENAALTAVDPKTGQILTMVGSRGYFDDAIDGKYNIAVAERQPGSSFKPFVYATAFAKGYTPNTVVFDLATQFNANCNENDFETHDNCYSPKNYDEKFRGPMTLRDALAQSVNIPAVKVLYLAGIKESLETAGRLGLSTLTRPIGEYGLPLVLGGGEVKLLEMTGAYGVFGNDGVRQPLTAILKINDAKKKVLEEYEENGTQALDIEVARTINNVLSDDAARIPAFGAGSALQVPGYQTAAKTGTTNDYRDVWIVGYSPTIAVGAWAGNNDNTPMEKKVAGFIIAPLWNEFMRFALEKVPKEDFVPPKQVDTTQGQPILHGMWNGPEGPHSILYWVDKQNPLGGKPRNPYEDPQFRLWEYPVMLWRNGVMPDFGKERTESSVQVPVQQSFSIVQPRSYETFSRGELITVAIHNPFGENMKKVSYYINGGFIGASEKAPFSISFAPTLSGKTTISATALSNLGQVNAQVSITVK